MSEGVTRFRVPYADYLRLEQESAIKHEWLAGEVFAMAGGSPEHARLQAALAGVLREALAGRPCVVFGADLRIRSRETDIATYADASVVCGPLKTHPEDPDAVTNPVLVLEVLSPSTEAYDRGQKAAHYRRIAALQEYVLVAQDAPRIEVFRRVEGGRWEFLEVGAGESITLHSVGCTIAVDEVFAHPLAEGTAAPAEPHALG
jgi:Uma2 family endonuclease